MTSIHIHEALSVPHRVAGISPRLALPAMIG